MNYFLTAELIIGTAFVIKTLEHGWLMIPLSYLLALPIAGLAFVFAPFTERAAAADRIRSIPRQIRRGLIGGAVVIAMFIALALLVKD